jgi:hypothetical protein
VIAAPLEDVPLGRAQLKQVDKLVPAETGVGPEARQVDWVGRSIVPGEKLLRPAPGIIVDSDEAVRTAQDGAMVEKREKIEAEILHHIFKETAQIVEAGAAVRLFAKPVGEPRSVPASDWRCSRPSNAV